MPAHLIAEEGPLTGYTVDFSEGNEWIVGRDPDVADFILEDSTVSRKHVLFQKKENGIYAKNLSQVNPATINDLDIDELTLLKEGDQLKVGHTLFLFSEEELPELTPPEQPQDGFLKDQTLEDKSPIPEESDPLLPELPEELDIVEKPPQQSPKKAKKKKEKDANVYDTIFDDLSEEELANTREDPDQKSPNAKDSSENQNAYDTIFEEIEESSDELPFNFLNEAPFVLKVIAGPNTGAEIGLEKNRAYVIGKDASTCDIIFQDLSVSRNHARLHIGEDGQITIEDLGSKNKTFVNSSPISDKMTVTSQDFISLGTTTFLVLDRDAPTDTIYSPIPSSFEAPQEEPEEELVLPKEKKKNWKEQVIPGKYLVFGGSIALILFIMFMSFFSLFKSNQVEVAHHGSEGQIEDIVDKFSGVEFSYTPSTGRLFLVGNVSTSVDHQELLYRISELNFVSDVEDHVMIDELVWKNINEVLSTNEAWRGVQIRSPKPGHFIATGYVTTPQQSEELQEYLGINFPDLELFENQVVVENILTAQIESMLQEQGFSSIKIQLSAGELILSGRYAEDHERGYKRLLKGLEKLPGVRSAQNFAILSSANSARIDISQNYRVTGYAAHDRMNFSVVINGQILTLGDAIDGMTITDIEPRVVLLENDGLKYRIDYSR